MVDHPIPTSFTFSYVVQGKNTRRQTAELTETELVLGDARIPISAIADTSSRLGFLAVAFREEFSPPPSVGEAANEDGVVVIVPVRIASRDLELAIDRRSSVFDLKLNHERLRKEGNEDLIRSEQCRICRSEVDLSGVPDADYIYCRYCGSIFSTRHDLVIDADTYGTCDQCGMFDRVQRYNEFYFYFLVLAWGYRSQQRFTCDACANTLFYKTLFANILFIVGVPNSISIKIRSLIGRDARLADLARANRLARSGRFAEADPIYDKILERWPNHPGVLTNRTIGHINGNDFDGGKIHLLRALTACFQYPPALRLMG